MPDLTSLLEDAVNACGVCGYGGLQTLLDMGDQPLAETLSDGRSYPLILMECGNCGLVQLSHAVAPGLVFPLDHPYTTGNNAELVQHYGALTDALAPPLPQGAVVVDIGANDGTLLASWPDRLRKVAVEPTNQALKCLDQGFVTYQDFFSTRLAREIRGGHGAAQIVTACNVLAHVPDVHDFMNGVSLMLGDLGLFVTENHDLRSITEGLQIDTVYHEHLRYFSAASLTRLMLMHGFQICSLQFIPTHGGSILLIAQKRTGNLGGRAREAARKLHLMLEDRIADGATIFGIAATTRATPLIHFARIAPYIECVCEVSGSEKIGYLIPGTQIPVVDEAELLQAQPDYAVIFAWHIAHIIVPRLRELGYKGQFIIPLPEARVLDG